jgi:hypothetical protein
LGVGSYNGEGWRAGFITSDISNSSYSAQVSAIKSMSGTWAHELNSITLTIAANKIVSNKIIIGVRRDGSRQELSTCAGSINATIKLSSTLNVSYNQGSGNIVAYAGSTYNAPSAPAQVRAYEDDQIHIAPLTPSITNYQLVYNESLAPLNKSQWKKKNASGGYTSEVLTPTSNTFSMLKSEDNWTYEAQMKRLCNATFQTNVVGGTTLTVVGNSVSSPATTQIVEGNTVSVTAPSYVLNNSDYLDYYFSNWDGTYTTKTKTFTINNHETHTANYTRKANVVNCFAWDFTNVAVGNDIQLTWNEHPNTNVTQYRIWRKEKNGTEMYIATVNRGTTSYTDNSFQYASASDPDKNTLFYSVSVYCTLDGGTWNEGGAKTVTAVGDILQKEAEKISAKAVPSEYELENYPNPFNPTTTISYQLPEAGMVTLKVYDMLGKEVATLVNEVKQAGYYSATFDASKIASGIYISTIQTNKFTQSKKMLLVK